MSYCRNCGAELPAGTRFCPTCGMAVENEPVRTQAPQPQTYQQPQPQAYRQPVYQQPPQPVYQQQYAVPAQNPAVYTQPVPYAAGAAPVVQQTVVVQQNQPLYGLRTNRSLSKFFWLSLITFGIYGLVVMIHISNECNLVISRYDGRKTMSFALVFFLFSWLTFGIVPIVWEHKICGRIGRELQRRGIDYSFGAKDFWLWGILGSLIVCGPFIYYHKFMKAMNLMNADYNVKG